MSSRTKPKKSAAPLAKKPLPKRVSGVAPKPAKGRAKLTEVEVPKAAKRPSEVTKAAKPKSKRSSAGALAAVTEETTSKHAKLRAKDAAAKKPAKAAKVAKPELKEPARAKSGAAKPAKKVGSKSTAAGGAERRAEREATRPKPRKGRAEAVAPGTDGELDSRTDPSDELAFETELEAEVPASDGAESDGGYERAVDAPTLLSDISEIRGARAEEIAADLGLDPSTMGEEGEEEASPIAPPASRGHLKSVIESLVFVADQAITPLSLGRIVKAKQADVRALLDEIRADYEGRGIELIEVGGGFQFRSAAASAPFVRDLVAHRPVRLTRAQLETLALIAYRQPITRPEIDDVRGVDSGSAIKVLLDRDLVKILGRKDEAGRPLLYGTGPQFLEFFGMKSLQDLPTLREFTELNEENRELFQRKMGEIPDLSDPAFNPTVAHSEAEPDEDAEPAAPAEARDEWSEDATQPVEPPREEEPEALDRAPSDELEPDAPDASELEPDREELDGEALEPDRDAQDDEDEDQDAEYDDEQEAVLDEDVQGEASDDELDSEDEGDHDDDLDEDDEHQDHEDDDEDADEDSERDFEGDDDPHASHEDEADADDSDDDEDESDDDDDDGDDDDDDGDETEEDSDQDDEDDPEDDDDDENERED